MTATDTTEQVDSSAESSEESTEDVDTPYSAKELATLVKVHDCAITHTGFLMTCMLQDLQIENAEFRHQLRRFNSGTISSASSPAVSTTTSNPLEQYSEDFDQLGRSFCVFNEIWVRPHHLRQPYPEDLREVGPRHPTRYSSDQAKRSGVIAELYEFVPLRFHNYLENSNFFADKVCTAIVPQTIPTLIYSSSALESSQ